MKKLICLMLFSIIFTQMSEGALKSLPDDLLSSDCILFIKSNDDMFIPISVESRQKFNECGVRIDSVYFLNPIQSVRQKTIEKVKSDIKNRFTKCRYFIVIEFLFLNHENEYGYKMGICKYDEARMLYGDYVFTSQNEKLEDLFTSFRTKLNKQSK